MKRTTKTRLLSALFFALALSMLGPIVAIAAESGACYNIGDADARSYCLARARRDAGTCYTIQRADLRAQCLAEVRQ